MSAITLHHGISFPHPSHASEAHTADIYSIAVSSRHLISCSRDRSIRIWNLDGDGQQRLAHPALRGEHASSVLCCSVHEESDRFASSDVDGIVAVWRLSTAELVGRWKAHADSVLGLALGAKVLVTGGKDGAVKVWNVERTVAGEEPPFGLLGSMGAAVNAVVLSKDESDVFAGAGNGALRHWHLAGETKGRDFDGRRRGICSLSLARDGKRVFSGHSGGRVGIFDVERATELVSFDAHATSMARSVQAGAVGGREDLVVSGSYDGTVKIWMEQASGRWELVSVMSLQQEFDAGDNRVLSVAFNQNVVFYCGQSPYVFARRIEASEGMR
ncbi:f-box and wd domain protein [Diplodia corticola]|uniref:F-box and wd domain protein n=1 Tax=Diplodia corticola TaxID=236234 RepID=A0A1J9RXL9_9PEZI|nr:f-box and wd domain protein [Diplodia corticola]OJD32580.1 f-box and wd domain protein [Diplodia corticola]